MKRLILDSLLQEQVQVLMDKANEHYDSGYVVETINLLKEAWAKLPEPKGQYSESFHIVRFISETYLNLGEIQNAKEWSEKLFHCALHRIDGGERNFLTGKIAYDSGDLTEARKNFDLAYKKSRGTCFEDENLKYLNFYRN